MPECPPSWKDARRLAALYRPPIPFPCAADAFSLVDVAELAIIPAHGRQ